VEHDYTYPKPASIDYFAGKGMNITPVLWQRLRRLLALQEAELQRLGETMKYAASKKLKVIIDIHNYASYAKGMISTRKTPRDALGNQWRQLAVRYKGNNALIFGLMNEPTGLRTEAWLGGPISRLRRPARPVPKI